MENKQPKEKAKELVEKYVDATNLFGDETCEIMLGQQLALIAVDEVLSLDFIDDVFIPFSDKSLKEYYQEVKQEIKKI